MLLGSFNIPTGPPWLSHGAALTEAVKLHPSENDWRAKLKSSRRIS